MAEHLMEKKWQEIFPIYQATTRPDKAAAALVEGRVVVVFDNSPEVIIAPATINTLFQTADDYYNRWPVATFARMIRYVAAFIAVGLPGLYIAIACYHRELIPDKLLYAIADARSQLSFPVVVEVLIMELLFELLREAGIRLPSQLGNKFSRGSISADELIQILDFLECQLIIEPKPDISIKLTTDDLKREP